MERITGTHRVPTRNVNTRLSKMKFENRRDRKTVHLFDITFFKAMNERIKVKDIVDPELITKFR